MVTSEINYNSGTIVDLENDSITPEVLLEGETAHDATGASIRGTMRTVPDSAMLGGKPPSYYLPAVNLLDNPDFAIAQAGYPVWDSANQKWTSGLHGSELYAADRWIGSFYDSTFSRNGNVNHFETKSDIYAFISQKLFGDGREKGKSYTFAITLADGTVAITTGTFPSADVTTQTTIGTVIVKSNCRLYILKETNGYVRLRIDLTQPNSFVDFLHVAFYEGTYTAETLPPYVPRPYAVELAECQRYYYQTQTNYGDIYSGILSMPASSNNGIVGITFPQTMRTVPTIKVYATTGKEGTIIHWASDAIVENMNIQYRNEKAFGLYKTGSLSAYNVYAFHYTASADL